MKAEDKQLTNLQQVLSGLAAGTTGSLVIGPTELIKVQLSVSRQMGSDRLRPSVLIVKIFKKEGLQGLTRGLGMTWLRDCPSVAVYFWTYEFLKALFTPAGGTLPFLGQLMAGGGAGCFSWLSTYPVDVIKTQVQTGKGNTILEAVKHVLATDGPFGFLKGILPCLLRAFPVNATIFCIYEYLTAAWMFYTLR